LGRIFTSTQFNAFVLGMCVYTITKNHILVLPETLGYISIADSMGLTLAGLQEISPKALEFGEIT